MIKVASLNGEQNEDILRIMQAMKTAKPEPSEKCTEGKEHNFQFVMHGDGAKSYFNLFECEHCHEFVKQEHQRTGDDAALWAVD